MVKNSTVENYTVIVTKKQTNGRGQMHTKWLSEPNKNLTFSILLNNLKVKLYQQKYLNFAVSLAIYKVLKRLDLKNIAIKWANDIMSDNKKICGILIENSLKKDIVTSSIVGIGLNVNQTNFPESIKNVTSLKLLKNKDFNLDDLLEKIVSEVKNWIQYLDTDKKYLEDCYLKNLYKKDKVATFRDVNDNLFTGMIIGISKNGKLQIKFENDTIQEFGIKEIAFA